MGRLSIDLAQVFSNIQPQDGRLRHLLRSERTESMLNALHRHGVEQPAALKMEGPEMGEAQDNSRP